MTNTNTFLKGMDGELEVKRILNNIEGVKYIDNLYLQTVRGTCQIDFIVIAKSGIYVVEVKNITGEVFMNENDSLWKVRTINNSYTILNPILQNSRHILNLRRTIGLEGMYINLVVFPERSNLVGKSSNTTTYSGLYAIQNNKRDLLSDRDIEIIHKHLTALKDKNRPLSIKHNRNTKRFLR